MFRKILGSLRSMLIQMQSNAKLIITVKDQNIMNVNKIGESCPSQAKRLHVAE